MSPSDKKWHVVPPEEQRCVWMTAGILSYQLCDRRFECDNCPLDAAIRNRLPRTTPACDESTSRNSMDAGKEVLRDDRLYSRNHCWTKTIDAGLVRVGIEPGLSEALLAPKAIVFPSTGQRIHRGQTCLWIVMEGGTLPVDSPLDGVIRSTNHQLADQPYLLSRQPLDNGWLFELEAEAPVVGKAGLMNRDQADPKYGADQDRFLASLRNAASRDHQSVGPTLADGGQRLQNIADMLGPNRYFALLRKVFC